jgi:Transposase
MPERRKYDAEFREGAVTIVRETGKPIVEVARDLGTEAVTASSPHPDGCVRTAVLAVVAEIGDRRVHRGPPQPTAQAAPPRSLPSSPIPGL